MPQKSKRAISALLLISPLLSLFPHVQSRFAFLSSLMWSVHFPLSSFIMHNYLWTMSLVLFFGFSRSLSLCRYRLYLGLIGHFSLCCPCSSSYCIRFPKINASLGALFMEKHTFSYSICTVSKIEHWVHHKILVARQRVAKQILLLQQKLSATCMFKVYRTLGNIENWEKAGVINVSVSEEFKKGKGGPDLSDCLQLEVEVDIVSSHFLPFCLNLIYCLHTSPLCAAEV